MVALSLQKGRDLIKKTHADLLAGRQCVSLAIVLTRSKNASSYKQTTLCAVKVKFNDDQYSREKMICKAGAPRLNRKLTQSAKNAPF
jgi:hypothetical protein